MNTNETLAEIDAPIVAIDDVIRGAYQEHYSALLSYLLKLTRGDRGWAEEVIQEVMIRAWNGADRLNATVASIRPWMFTVARNIVIDRQRRNSIRPQEVGPTPLDFIPAHDEIDRRLNEIVVADALSSLSEVHRSIIIELYYNGLTAAQAAARLNIPAGTAKSRIFYALKALRLALEERGVTRGH